MTGIDNLSRLYAALHRRIDARENLPGKIDRAPPVAKPTGVDRKQFRQQLEQRLSKLPHSGDRGRLICRALVESTLVWQFGQRFVDAPDALEIITDLETMLMESDDYQDLVRELLRDYPGREGSK